MQVSFKEKKPTLYIVSTPIGNLEDITFRAINTLKDVSVCFAEDTRVTSRLFNHYNINTKLISYHEHNKYLMLDEVLKYLENNEDIALVSDAGTPGVSDPGYELIKEVIDRGYYVVSIPGVTAATTALTSSGLDIQPYLFYGFLKRKKNEIVEELRALENTESTLVFYESPYRIKDTIKIMYETLGNRNIVVARELTKMYETFYRFDLEEAVSFEFPTKGEYVIVLEKGKPILETRSISQLYNEYIKVMDNEKEIFKTIAKDLGISRREVYQKIKIDNKEIE